MCQHERRPPHTHHQGLWRLHRCPDHQPGGTVGRQEVAQRDVHHTFCPRLHPHSSRCSPGAGPCSHAVADGQRPAFRCDVDLPRTDVPRGVMPLCAGHLGAADILRCLGRCLAPWHTDKRCQLYRHTGQGRHCGVRQNGHTDPRSLCGRGHPPRRVRRATTVAPGSSRRALLDPPHRCRPARRLPPGGNRRLQRERC